MYSLIRALLDSLLEWASTLAGKRGKATDAPTDHGFLRRAGDRIREWVHADGASQRSKSDQDGT